jgi:hypothetical protein
VLVVPRVLVPVIVTVTGTEKRAVKIGQVRAQRLDDGSGLACEALLENAGNVAVLVNGGFTLEQRTPGQAELELAEASVGPVTSLPGTKMTVKGRIGWPKSMAGLAVRSLLRFGPDPRDVTESAVLIEDTPAGPHDGAHEIPSDRLVSPATSVPTPQR